MRLTTLIVCWKLALSEHGGRSTRSKHQAAPWNFKLLRLEQLRLDQP